MKLLHKLSLAAVAVLALAQGLNAAEAISVDDTPRREHRAVWMSAYLGSNWPSSSITANNAESHKRLLATRLDKFKDQNVNVLYYHVRSMCDAMYESAYEPWSAQASGTRGVAPAFDPFGYLLEQAHARGMEVYAWVNPYRYCGAISGYGTANANDYENCHPEWLIRQSKESILNPGIPEVRQRIADVCLDIITKYDVDGVVFDDYFYSNPTPLDLDADLYNAYKNAGGKADQRTWRRDNVNAMVKLVSETIKAAKPWVAFGISPAGFSSPPNCLSEYGIQGLTLSGYSDWQYNSIASDPLNWVKNGYVDYIAPQIYWPSGFNTIDKWWADAVAIHNRHLYAAVSITSINTWGHAEFARELKYAREVTGTDAAGVSYFQYDNFVNSKENVLGRNQTFGENMRDLASPTKALTPLRSWNNVQAPAMVSNLNVSGSSLSWNAPASGDYRYCVYCIPNDVPDVEFAMEHKYIHGITYSTSYTIPAEYSAGYRWAVSCYDRYGNEYSPLVAGESPKTAQPAKLTFPENHGKASNIFEFTWTGQGNRFIVELAHDANFNDIIGWIETPNHKASVTKLPELVTGNPYYWRVRTHQLNAPEVVSETYSFEASRMAITVPAPDATGVSLTPVVSWDKAADKAVYHLEIALDASFTNVRYEVDTKSNSVTVPDLVLCSARKYYARVSAKLGDVNVQSDVVSFTTLNITDYQPPVIINPSSVSGQVLHANESVKIQPVSGAYSMAVYISTTDKFPSRTSYQETLLDFASETKPMSEVKISSKNLVDGETYYLRARCGYYITGSTSVQYTDYTDVYSFVYSSQEAQVNVVGDIDGDGEISIVDVVLVCNIVLENGFNPIADLDGDGSVSIGDVVKLVNMVLTDESDR